MKKKPSTKPVTVGLIGCGNISAAYLRAAPQFPELQLVACADLDLPRAEARAREFGLRPMSVEALLEDKAIEVVLNLTVPQAHVPVGLAAIAHGKHVYGEKPLATSTKEARRLLAAAAKKRLLVGSAPDTFLGGAHQTARRLIDEGAIGKPLSGTAFMMNHGHEHWHPDPAFYYAPGGGPMFDMGPYYLTNLVNLLGPVAEVSGVAIAGFTERQVLSQPRKGEIIKVRTPTHVTGLLTFVSGTVISITTSFDVWVHRHGNMEIYGSEGSLVVPDPNRFGGTVSLARGRDPWTDVPLSHGFADGNLRIVGLADFARAIRARRPHRCNGEVAFHVLEVMEAFQESGKARRAVKIKSRCERPAALPRHALLGELN